MINGFISAIRILTRIPIKGKDAKDFSSSLYWFPIVGITLNLNIIKLRYGLLSFGKLLILCLNITLTVKTEIIIIFYIYK